MEEKTTDVPETASPDERPVETASPDERPVEASPSDERPADVPERALSGCGKRAFTPREKALSVATAIAVALAAAGFGLFGASAVPADAAAKVNDTYLSEQSVADWIGQYRAANALADDDDFASMLASQGMTVSALRISAVNQLALSQLVCARASELGATPSDEQAQQQVDAMKAAVAFNDDDVWADTLDMYGFTEDGLREQYKTNLAQRAVCEHDVAHREATDEETLAYVQTYLANTTQKHAYRIVFLGEDAQTRAEECYGKLRNVAADGLTVEEFSALAREYSDEEGVGETGGSYAWSGSSMDSEVKDLMEDLDVGSTTGIKSMQDGSVVILFCDEAYTFPASDGLSAMPEGVPEGLLDEVALSASNMLWESDSDAYLASLLAKARITYYPVPSDASYNVDVALAWS